MNFAETVWGESQPQRRVLELVAEHMIQEKRSLKETGLERNGAATAACFLSRLMCVCWQLRHHASSNELWGPLLFFSFGADCAASLEVQLPTRGPRLHYTVYKKVVHELRIMPSLWFRGLCHERGGRTIAVMSPEHRNNSNRQQFRTLSHEERSRVVFWRAGFRLVDDLGDAFDISPSAAAKLKPSAAASTLGNGKLTERLLREGRQNTRILDVVAPDGRKSAHAVTCVIRRCSSNGFDCDTPVLCIL